MSKIDEILKEHHSGEEIEKFENIKRECRDNAVYADYCVLRDAWKVVMFPVALFATWILLFCYGYVAESEVQISMAQFLYAPYLVLLCASVLSCIIWWPPKDKRKLFEEGVYKILSDKFTLSLIFSMVAIQIISAMWIVFMKRCWNIEICDKRYTYRTPSY